MLNEITTRICRICTGLTIAQYKAASGVGADCLSTISDLRLIIGWENYNTNIPANYYPVLVMEPGTVRINRTGKTSDISIGVDFDIITNVAGKDGGLLGTGTSKGLLQLVDTFKDFLLANQRLEVSGIGYTNWITDITCLPNAEVGSDGLITRRLESVQVNYLKKHITEMEV